MAAGFHVACDNCGSSDAKIVYGEDDWWCYACNKGKRPGSRSGKSFEVIEEELYMSGNEKIADIQGLPIRGFKEREITKSVTDFFGVRAEISADGTVAKHFYPYGDKAYKCRVVAEKEFYWIGKSDELFGRDKFSSDGRRLIITEGELDAMSIAQAAFAKYSKIYPVVSLPSSSGTKSLLKHRDWVRSFSEVVLCLDQDEAGQKCLAECIKIIGAEKIKIVKLPVKDASDMLVAKGAPALMTAVFEAGRYTPAGIVSKEEVWKALVEYNDAESLPYPPCLEGLNSKLKGMRLGEIALFISGTGCFGLGTEILMANGAIKMVEDIIVGDQVAGPDSIPRSVLSLKRGEELMSKITLRDGTSFTCNESHVLSLANSDSEGRWGLVKDQVVDVKLSDYRKWSDKRKHLSKAFKCSELVFSEAAQVTLHPYILGVWLGDGYSDGARFSCHEKDVAIIDKMRRLGMGIYKGVAAFTWNSPGGLRAKLALLGLIGNKHIPLNYLRGSVDCRLELLAGLLDTDGHYDGVKNIFEFSQKSEEMTLSVKFLAESLGFTCTLGKQVNNKFGNCFRLWIAGEGLEAIPTELPRKQARPRQQVKNPHRYSFTVEVLGEDNFYGFEVDGDHRFVLGNFVVTHNSGKSTMLRETMLHIIQTTRESIGIIALEEAPAETARKLAGMQLMRNPAAEEISIEDLTVGFEDVYGDDRIFMLDHQGSMADVSIVNQLEYMALMGCKYLFIDHITILVSEGAEDLTGNEAVDKIMNHLLRIAKKHNVWIGLVSHLRKAQSGQKSFEEGRLPSIDDIRGSGSIKQISFDIISFARNLIAEDPIERNTIKMRVLKSRYTGLTGSVRGAQYHYNTGRLEVSDFDPDSDLIEI
jgi:hypothetical protein